ncbi:PEP/pyruvate-binding domain-containing protein [Romeriopsis navalis]|uniref:PEP/pyruvate-binding domain-containing protein n=1 Tax=Romeriopsis navalis TaxID=2992132 RepID=UPI0021F87092|nr:PEP/pyruvate-binding domain-containing protein [Romeriopsis navalis]
MVSVQTSSTFKPQVMGSVANTLRSLTPGEAEALQFVSHDKILTWEGLVEHIGKPNATVHLIDTTRFEGHYGYTRNALGRGASYTQFNFYSEVQFPQTRRYMPFLVFDFRDRPLLWNGQSYRWVLNIRRYDYKDSHQALADMLAGLRTLLSKNLMAGYGEPLLFVYEKPGTYRRPHIQQLTEVKAAGFETITEQQMIEAAGGALVSVLNPGTAIGYLELIKVGEDGDHLTPRHIAVFEDTPERIPPITGIVTLEPQTPLSHVNLLAKNRGTPNVSTAKMELIPSLAGSIGKLVKMVAKPDGTVTFTPVSQAEAEQFWASKTKDQLEVPTITATSLDPVEFATGSPTDLALPNIGSKASNYAVLQNRLDPTFVKPGFGLSFAHYQQIAAEPDTQIIIRDLLARKNLFAPEEINALLKLIRKSIEKHTSDATIAPAIAAVRAVIAKMPGVKRIRLRSSTNSEDLPTFNGAGLYESKGFNVDDSDQKLRKKLLKVMASLWLERAFWEREIFAIDHADVGMAILINPAFSDEFANGVVVGTEESNGFRTWVNAQKGEASVTNPLDDELPESFAFVGDRLSELQVQSRSNIGSVFLVDGADTIRNERQEALLQLRQVTQQLYEHFVEAQRAGGDRRKYGIDIEYKLMQEGDAVRLYVKQSRLLNLGEAAPDPPTGTRVVAKDNGMGGAHLRRYPKQLSELRDDQMCIMKVNQVVGINRVEDVGNGFAKINVVVPCTACPSFKGEVYVFRKHFNFL